MLYVITLHINSSHELLLRVQKFWLQLRAVTLDLTNKNHFIMGKDMASYVINSCRISKII
jgi:hypothetical protein